MSEQIVTQKVVLKIEEYLANLKKANATAKSTTDDTNKALTNNSKVFAQNESQVKQWGKSVTDELSKYGSKMKENFSLGAKAMTLDLGRDAIKKAGRDALEMAFSFSKAFAEIKSRSNASEGDLQKWKKSIMSISASTTANMDSMAESFKDMFSSVKNPEELLKIMNSIGDAAAMGDGDAAKVSSFVTSTLKGQGREVNKANVDDVLGASDILRRKGVGFKDMDDAMSAMGSISGQELSKSKLTSRDLASILAGATASGSSKNAALGGVGDLIKASNNGLMEGSVLAAVLGTGKLTDKNGKFDIGRLGKKGAYQNLLNYGGGDEKKAREVFAKISGLSSESSDAVFNMVKNFKDLNKTVQESEHDQKSFAQSAAEAKDNLVNAYSGFKSGLIKGVTDILGGFEGPVKSLMQGHVGDAAGGMGGALTKAGAGIAEHPALVAGTLATVLGGGVLIGSLLKKVGGGSIGGTAVGVAEGLALKNAGVTPVFVVNATEIGRNTESATAATLLDKFTKASNNGMGTIAGTAAKAGGLGFMGTLGGIAAGGSIGIAMGGAANAFADEHASTNKYGDKYNVFEKGIAKMIPEWMGGMSSQEYKDNYTEAQPQKVVVEIDVKDPGLMARPKAGDSLRDGRNY